MNVFKSKTRKKAEKKLVEIQSAITRQESEMASRKVSQSLKPHEYAHYSCVINDLKSDARLLQEILQ